MNSKVHSVQTVVNYFPKILVCFYIINPLIKESNSNATNVTTAQHKRVISKFMLRENMTTFWQLVKYAGKDFKAMEIYRNILKQFMKEHLTHVYSVIT